MRDVADDLSSILHTHTALPVVAIPGFWGSSQNLPQKWSPHCLVDMVTMHNVAKTECFLHLARHVPSH